MKRNLVKLAVLGTLAFSSGAHAQTALDCDPSDAKQVRLQISVTGMHSAAGYVTITIYPDDKAHFLDGKFKLARQQLKITLPTTQACFALAAPGNYAVALFHDENANGHLDTNFLGIPTEGYGFSRNPTLFTGPPDVDQVKVAAHVGDNPIPVLVKY